MTNKMAYHYHLGRFNLINSKDWGLLNFVTTGFFSSVVLPLLVLKLEKNVVNCCMYVCVCVCVCVCVHIYAKNTGHIIYWILQPLPFRSVCEYHINHLLLIYEVFSV